ncbi:hypothetical protein AXG93_1293s1100 [Marchantia polymorpha subsp. ruderalis]|uniref:Uncharacterized protein n=1 Tax=Marchantia polymorpha subsp. ruderalis TaxID=1480154 RepID=A0A176WF25_MARPO|nr:hypothetical protein AXG93_1293s1100 [Marchantia polymorpha subsp. ruderalis]
MLGHRGNELLTKEEEKQFPKEREILAIESSKGPEKEDNVQPEVPPQRTTRVPVQTRSVGSEDVPQPNTSEELVKELMLSKEILEHIVAQVGGTVVVLWKHEGELMDWVKKLANDEAARSLEVECKVKFELECGRLQKKLKLVAVQLEELQGRVKKAEMTHQQLRDKTTDELRLRVEMCLRGFAMWKLQTVKWLKLDLLERRLMSTKASGYAEHKQLVELVNSFSSRLEDARENIQIEIVNVLRMLGADGSSEDAVDATSDGTAPKSSSPWAVEMFRRSK